MAKKSMILKQQAPAKFSTRKYNRCKLCGRPHAYLRDYGVCRICFRTLAYKGEIPGVRKASWYSFFLLLRWQGVPYTKYGCAMPPRLRKKSSPGAGGGNALRRPNVPKSRKAPVIQDGERSLVIKHWGQLRRNKLSAIPRCLNRLRPVTLK